VNGILWLQRLSMQETAPDFLMGLSRKTQYPQGFVVKLTVARGTERHEIQFGIISRAAAEFHVVDLEIGHRAAGLTAPGISSKHPLT
jgi:hypothetical protein